MRSQVPSTVTRFWDELYREEGYAYGTAPNAFLVSVATLFEPGKVLSLGEGEGRNAVYLASLGFEVTAIDASEVAIEKTQRLAREHQVKVETYCADLASIDLGEDEYETVISIFCHVAPATRRRMHSNVIRAMRPGGMFVLEAFRPEQLARDTGGPQELALLYTREQLLSELPELVPLRLGQVDRVLHEGRCHQGQSAVLELVARKPHRHRQVCPLN